MAKIKYLGSAQRRVLEKGEDFGGQLAKPLSSQVVWDNDNHYLVDSSEAGLSKEAVELLLVDDSFRDVEGLKTIPLSVAEQRTMGRTGRVSAKEVIEQEEPSETNQSTPTSGTTPSTPSKVDSSAKSS